MNWLNFFLVTLVLILFQRIIRNNKEKVKSNAFVEVKSENVSKDPKEQILDDIDLGNFSVYLTGLEQDKMAVYIEKLPTSGMN
jgi:hypothetical protein